jgi:hypothetical protein
MEIKDLATGFAWWDNQVEHFLVHPELFAALLTRHLLLPLGSSPTG